jgi:hypothetical protein
VRAREKIKREKGRDRAVRCVCVGKRNQSTQPCSELPLASSLLRLSLRAGPLADISITSQGVDATRHSISLSMEESPLLSSLSSRGRVPQLLSSLAPLPPSSRHPSRPASRPSTLRSLTFLCFPLLLSLTSSLVFVRFKGVPVSRRYPVLKS